jgi:hypothetical protein
MDPDWAWQAYLERYGAPLDEPDRVKLDYFQYRPGARAVIGYVSERRWDDWLVEDHFAFELLAGQEVRLFRYPEDPYLPGLELMASPLSAQEIVPKYVPLHPQRLAIEAVRYRPTARALIRQQARFRRRTMGSVVLYARILPPRRIATLITAGELVVHSGFAIPRLAGYYEDAGVVWLSNVPGKTVRQLIRGGKAPEPEQLLDGLAPLWSASVPDGMGQPLDVLSGFGHTKRVLSRVLPDGDQHELLGRLLRVLEPFAESWRPSAPAHNDFYDDQMIVTPENRIALVDFEEAGPGDPLIDVGNMLAHLGWMGRFSSKGQRFDAYGEALRAAALERFGWERRELALRESYSLFRLASNPVRRFSEESIPKSEAILALALEALESA